MSRTVLILGSQGRFGQAVTKAFAEAGWQVLAQARRPQATLPKGAVALALPLHDTAALLQQASQASVVVYGVNPIYTRWDEEAMPLLEQGLALAKGLGASFLFPGNVYAFGERMPALLREDTPCRPTQRKGEIRAAMEERLRQHSAQGGHSLVLRAGDFFGTGTGTWMDQAIVKSLASGRIVYPGPLNVAHAWAYLPDVAQALVGLAERGPSPGQFETFHFSGHTCTGAQWVAEIERQARGLGLNPKKDFRVGGMPWGVIRVGGLLVPMWRELARMSYLWRVPHALDGRALQTTLARQMPVPHTPLPAAMRDTLLSLGFGAASAGSATSQVDERAMA